MATKAATSSVAIAMAFAGRSARACDVCASKNAHWFCAADDAYLCTACDTQVHSANALSLRHERVRLSPNGAPMKPQSKAQESRVPQGPTGCAHAHKKKLHSSPVQVLPSCKRSRTSRPYTHHLRKLTRMVSKDLIKAEDSVSELELFDFLDADEFLNDGNQEVPSLSDVVNPDVDSPSPCSSDFDLLSSDYEFQESDHSASADSFAAYFKGRAAQTQAAVSDDNDQFGLVPDAFDFCLDAEMADAATAPTDANIDLSGDAFFFPGDIPGLEGLHESFAPEISLTDDFTLSFDLALQNAGGSFQGAPATEAFEVKPTPAEPDHVTAGPFAKFFAQKVKSECQELPISPEMVKREAKAMLKFCCQDDGAQKVPSLQLNLGDVLSAWSDREAPWIASDDSNSSGMSDVGLVPDLDAATTDDSQSGGDRGARVMRYKEKRATRLFSKKIRYEVRKLNAERRPRMKGRFVKRTSTSS